MRATRVMVILLAAGCATELDVKDHSVLFPTLRASKAVGDLWSVNVIADYASGSDTATGSVGRPIVIGGQSFPGAVDVDFDLTTVRIEGRARREISPEWLVEGFFGVCICEADVSVSTPSARASEHQFEAGPHVGGRIGWRPVPRLQVYAEGYGVCLFPDGIVPDAEAEVGVEFKAAGPVSVLAGWRFRNLELILEDSDYDFEWSGLFVGLGFDF
ncbi:MAG TPA: hypothetical protein VFY93_13120 [Planctomycetota bacterium]|nr:hypothetical protein [Planctomycetota bacterium]